MNESIVSAEAKARLTEAVKNYAPPAPEKYRALEDVKDCIAELRNKKASYQTIRTMLKDNAGIEVSHQTVARYCREMLTPPKATRKSQRQQKTTDRPAPASAPFETRRPRGPRIADIKPL